MALTKKQEKQLNSEIKKTLEKVRWFQGLKAGAAGILGVVLEMCNSGKTDTEIVKDVRDFCENSLNMDGMKTNWKGEWRSMPNELRDTIEMMNSGDYKERFKAEYYQVVIRYQKLKSMLDKWDNDQLEFTPTCPRSTYNMQIAAMTDYIAVLEARAVMEGVEL